MRPRKTPLFAITVLITSALSTSSSYAEPSLGEATEWLQAKLAGVSGSQVLTVRCNSGRVTTHTTTRVIKSVSIGGGILRVNEQWMYTHSDDVGDFPPSKQIVLQLNELYAACRVKKMTVDPVAPGRSCASEMTRLPYEITLSGPNKKYFSIWLDDQELAERIGKALKRVIKLSGGKEEVY